MTKTSGFSAMDTSKKIKLIAIIVSLLVVIYLFFGFFSGPSNDEMQITPAPATVQGPAPTVVEAPKNVLMQKTVRAEDSPLLKDAKESQQKYLDASTELRLLQLQQKITETKQAITSSQLEMLKAQQEMKNLTSQPAPQPVSTAAYGQALENSQAPTPATAKPEASTSSLDSDYTLLYVANEGGEWQAIIGSAGKLYSVTPGSILPDGSKVNTISGTSVALEKDGLKKMISITPIM